MNGLPDAEALCARLVGELKAHIKPSTAMIGLYTGGAWLAERLHPQLGLGTPLGLMDIAFYRDDYHKQGLHHDPKRTRIGFEVEGRDLLLVDDVLYTGRTIRSALDALIDFGRPRSIQLIVLVDRGHRELPIKADYVGKNLPTSLKQSVQVRLQEIDGEDDVLLDDSTLPEWA